MVINRHYSRRSVLSGLAAPALLGAPCWAALSDPRLSQQYFAAAARTASGGFVIAILDAAGHLIDQQALPSRGHGFAWSSRSRQLVSFTRRPGWQMLVSTISTSGKIDNTREIDAAPERHFYGHGCFSADGRWLFTTENNLTSLEGVIGVYDVQQSFARVREFPSHGIGPHEMRLSNDGQSLLIANGGIATHPDRGQGSAKGREKLNLDTMRSNITLLNAQSGELLAKLDVPDPYHLLSLRHMSEDGNGRLWVGGQYQGDAEAIVPLVMSIDLTATSPALTAFTLPEMMTVQLNQYIGSVGYFAPRQQLACSAPKADKLLLINTANDVSPSARLDLVSLVSASGIATITSEQATAWPINSLSGQWYRRAEHSHDHNNGDHWQSSRTSLVLDNHLIALS